MKQKSLPWLILLFGLIFFVAACGSTEGPSEGEAQAAPPEEEEEARVPVEVALVETGDIALVLSYSGSLQPKDEVNVLPGANGRVEELLVEVGDRVKAGQPLAIIDDDTYQAQIKQAEAGLTQARLNLAKMELGSRPEEIAAAQAAVELARAALNDVAGIDDNERTRAAAELARAEAALRAAQTEYDKIAWAGDVGSTPQAIALERATIAYEDALASYNQDVNPSDSELSPLMLQLAQAELNLALTVQPFRQIDFATAQAGIQQAEAALDLANLQLDETTIEAPFDGLVAELYLSEGSRANPQSPVALFVSEELEAIIDVQENRIAQVKEGQFASLTVTAYPNQEFPGQITSVAPTADNDTRTFAVKISPTEGGELLRGGMFADVSILTEEKENTTLAPRAAINQGDEAPSVYVVQDDNSVQKRTVTTGLFDKNRIEILAGLDPGDVVVVAGQPNLEEGSQVELVNDPRIAE